MRVLGMAAFCAALGGCASITEGTSQNITVDVSPDSGTCVLSRKGQEIGVSLPGQRVVKVSKESADIRFQCTAEGYQPKDDVLSSSLSPATVASFFLLDFGIVDAATGAWKKYPERITIVLQPLPKPTPPPRRR